MFTKLWATCWAIIKAILIIYRIIYTKLVRICLGIVNVVMYKHVDLPKNDNPLLVKPAHELARLIREYDVTSETVVDSFIKRAKEIKSINAVVDTKYKEAIQSARLIDERLNDLRDGKSIDYSADRRPLPKTLKEIEIFPFLGVPFSCKENIQVDGMKNTAGLVCRRDVIAKDNAEVVNLLEKAGAIFINTSNVPELGLWWETSNCLYGTTSNPYDSRRTPGGSSGGEATLLATGSIPLSIGSDIGGSLRFPAFCCGVFSHKPSANWISLRGAGIFESKLQSTVLTVGPMARYQKDLVSMMQVFAPVKAKNLKEKVEAVNLAQLTIWHMDSLGGSPLYSPVDSRLTAIQKEVVDYLKSQGAHEQKLDMDLTGAYYYWKNKMADDYQKEPPMQFDMTNRTGVANLFEEWLRWLTFRARHTLPVLGYSTIQVLTKECPAPDPAESKYYWAKLKNKLMNKMGPNSVLILPTLPMIAPLHNEPLFNPLDFAFAGIFNAIEFPVTQVPLGLTKNKLPLGLQVATTPDNDHISLAVSAILEQKFGGWHPQNLSPKS